MGTRVTELVLTRAGKRHIQAHFQFPFVYVPLNVFEFLVVLYLGHLIMEKVRKVAKIRNRYNQVPHLTQDSTWESEKKHN